jgi:hypothetical protein
MCKETGIAAVILKANAARWLTGGHITTWRRKSQPTKHIP